jgi:hypothetical protein
MTMACGTTTPRLKSRSWDPAAARTVLNFNPFETWEGNSPDASGTPPGETGYKDPNVETSFIIMMEQRAEADEREANPKADPPLDARMNLNAFATRRYTGGSHE